MSAAVVVLVLAAACASDVDQFDGTPTPPSEAPNDRDGDAPAIISESEPGPRLTVDGQVVDGATGLPVANATVRVYQTDHSGTYQPEDPADESTARIRGSFTTDADGLFSFVTVLPGEYPNQPEGNRHIHFHSVDAEGYRSMGFVLLFDDNVRSEIRSWAQETGFGKVIGLEGTPDTGLRGTIVIELQRA